MKVRFATVGTSKITEKFLEAASSCSDFILEAVCSRSLERAMKFSERCRAKKYYDSLDALALDRDIDAVYIASPNHMHARQAVFLMEHGKHVLCEKALASNLREVQRMFQCAEENGVLLMEAMRSVHAPGYEEIRKTLGKLGKIRRARFSFCQYSSRYDAFREGKRQNIFDLSCSAGALMDIGIYCIEALIGLFGEPDSVSAAAVKLRGGIDGAGTILASYPEMVAELIYSKITADDLPCVIEGEKGSMYIGAAADPGDLCIHYTDGRKERISSAESSGNNMKYELEDFLKAINAGDRMERFRKISEASLKLADEARRQTGIRFPADGEDE